MKVKVNYSINKLPEESVELDVDMKVVASFAAFQKAILKALEERLGQLDGEVAVGHVEAVDW